MNSRLRILYIAYPLLPVVEASAGGAEQILRLAELQMARRGHITTVAACDGSQAAGELLPTGAPATEPDCLPQRDAQHNACILQFLARRQRSSRPFHLIHDMSGTFWPHARVLTTPVLATLHLPQSFYSPNMFQDIPANVSFNCVSEAQASTFSWLPRLLGVVPNGIELERFPLVTRKQAYLLWLGRFCPEKGAHLAIEAARQASLPLVLAGEVYPFSYHQQYFQTHIAPHLRNGGVRLVQTPCAAEKIRLLSNARALLITSLAEETSSLVAMEAAACGTPVIAFRRGALPQIVSAGVTGWLADSAENMAGAVSHLDQISPHDCRDHAERNFSADRMAEEYERLYRRMAGGQELQRKAA